jgi:putative tricarboxylic transport membrane protein
MDTIALLGGLLVFDVLLAVFAGVLIGILVGAIPGLNGAIGISLLLPLTFALEPQVGLLLLGGIYMGCMYGGSITAILINVPGDVVAAPVAMEGYPLTQQGRAKEALYYSIFSSMFGGLIGVIVLILFTPPLARFALQFGPAEMFFIALSGLIIVGALSGSFLKSAFAVLFGLFLSTVGIDAIARAERFTFGSADLRQGISVVPVVLGLFCISEVLLNIGKKASEQVTYRDQSIARLTSSATSSGAGSLSPRAAPSAPSSAFCRASAPPSPTSCPMPRPSAPRRPPRPSSRATPRASSPPRAPTTPPSPPPSCRSSR